MNFIDLGSIPRSLTVLLTVPFPRGTVLVLAVLLTN